MQLGEAVHLRHFEMLKLLLAQKLHSLLHSKYNCLALENVLLKAIRVKFDKGQAAPTPAVLTQDRWELADAMAFMAAAPVSW